MQSRYLQLKQIRKALLMAGKEQEAQKVMDAMQELIENGLVSAEEVEAAAYL